MTIAYDLRYAADHFVGIGTYAWRLIEALLARADADDYLLLWHPKLEARRYDVRSLATHPRVRGLEDAGAPLSPWTARRTAATLRARRPDVYVSPYHLLPDRCGCPRIVTLHDVRVLRMPGELRGPRDWYYRYTVRRAAQAETVLTVSEFSRSEILALSPARRVRVAPPGASRALLHLAPVKPAGVPDGPFALVVGDNRPHKDLDVLARVWARLPESVDLHLVGAGPVDRRHPDLAAFAARAGARRVTVLGRVGEAELAWLYRHAVLALCPCRYEGFGSPLAEALQQGVPVLASDIPAFRETGGDAPIFVPPGDAAAWEAAILRVVADPGERARRAALGPRRAGELTYERTAEIVHGIARSLAAGAAA